MFLIFSCLLSKYVVVLLIFCSCYNFPVCPVAYHTISILTKSFIEHSSYSISQISPSYRYLLPLSSSRLASAPSSSSLFLSLLHPPFNICSDRMLLSISECIITVYGVLMRFALGGRGRNYPSSRKWNKCLPPDGGSPFSTPAASPSSYKYAAFSNPLHYTFHRIRHTRV